MNNLLKKNVPLKKYNTMRICSVADYFIEATSKEDLIEGIKHAKEKNLNFLVIGGGSNIIFPEKYEGVVILLATKKIFLEEKEKIYLEADAGVFLPDLALLVNQKMGKGLEWAGGVPGTVGGAIRGNAGAFDDFTKDCVLKVKALNTDSLKEEVFDNKDCQFAYRESIFKKNKNYIILKAEMAFFKKEKDDGKFEEYLNYREKNHPKEPSSGSIFKNPVVDNDFYNHFDETKKFKKLGFVPMRFLIEKVGLKGVKIGGAKISEKHPNFIINENSATGEDVKKLINLVKEKIKEDFNIEVQEEVEII
jgi:UDP-N-acetylmuramate dehydrogenase